MSKRRPRPRSRLSPSSTGLSARTPAATGMLMKKIHSQPSPSVIGPPTSHAAVAPMPPIAAQMPSALLRSAPSANVVMTIDSAVGVMTAAATPWTTRAAISAATDDGEPAGERGEREQCRPDHEHAPPAEQVRRAAAEQQQAAEAEQVRAQHPLQVTRREAEVSIDRRQRHDHDRRVEDDHEERRAEQGERPPAPRVGARLGGCAVVWGGGHSCANLLSSSKKKVRTATLALD